MTSLDQNTAPLSTERLAEIKTKLERAHTEIGEVAAQGPHRRFRMSVPSRSDRDTDLIISDALDAAGDLLSEVDRLTRAVQVLGSALQLDSMAVIDELKRHAGDACLPIADVERFLKRERDEYEPGGECWNTVDDVLDCFRLHMVTGTPLTEPRPEEGPSDPSVGRPPLTEAEELRIDVARLTSERDQAVAAAEHMAGAMAKVGPAIEQAIRFASAGDAASAAAVLGDVAPEEIGQPAPQDGAA